MNNNNTNAMLDARHSFSKVVELKRRKQDDARRFFVEAVAKVASDTMLTDSEVGQLAQVLDEVELTPFSEAKGATFDDFERHVSAFKRIMEAYRKLDRARLAVEDLPTAEDLRRRLGELDLDLAEKIDRMLEPKREVERLIEERLEGDGNIHSAENAVSSRKRECPLLDSPLVADIVEGS